ncbi:hypothetical protein ACH4F6_03415 [Streptomyces sp. NPDC017936]|uniref:hypothetical protein n=1 Tax=Streptomyces sp. NPDC017936 TaxID=3365016 RepID=UPI0037BB05E5
MPHERLPSVKKLTAEIRHVRTQGGNTVRESAAFLHGNAEQLARYGSVEDLATAVRDEDVLAGPPGALNSFKVDTERGSMLDEARTWHVVR